MPQKTMKIRPAQPGDNAAIFSLLAEFELPLEGLENARVWVIQEADGNIVGTASLETWGKQGLLRSVAIKKDQQNQGYGTALVKFLINEATKEGIGEIYLLTMATHAFYEKLGFKECSRESLIGGITTSAEFKGACPKTATLMCL